jgi:hypothetical protein
MIKHRCIAKMKVLLQRREMRKLSTDLKQIVKVKKGKDLDNDLPELYR